MELDEGQFYKILIKLMNSPFAEVQYNCAGVIGHLAMNGNEGGGGMGQKIIKGPSTRAGVIGQLAIYGRGQ